MQPLVKYYPVIARLVWSNEDSELRAAIISLEPGQEKDFPHDLAMERFVMRHHGEKYKVMFYATAPSQTAETLIWGWLDKKRRQREDAGHKIEPVIVRITINMSATTVGPDQTIRAQR